MGYMHDDVKPDMVMMGKGISGGFLPVSGVVANSFIMDHIQPGDHGCTYGGNPLAMATAHAAVKCLVDEGMVENSREMGKLLLDELRTNQSPVMSGFRGRGLFVGMGIKQGADIKINADNLVTHLRKHGVITIKAKDQTVRLMPPLVITRSETMFLIEACHKAIEDLDEENKKLL